MKTAVSERPLSVDGGPKEAAEKPVAFRALEGRNLIAGGNAPGNSGDGSPTLQGSNKFGR